MIRCVGWKPFDDEDEEPTHVGDLPEEVEPQPIDPADVIAVEFLSEEITAPHDAEEWLHGFKAGHRGLRADYARAVRLWCRAFGFTEDKTAEIVQQITQLAEGALSRNKDG